MAMGSSLKSFRGLARVPPVSGAPCARAATGVAAVAPATGLAYGLLAVATLSASNPHEGELTVMTVTTEDACPMIVGRRTFSFTTEPLCGITKVIWAGATVIGLMSSTGEFLCVRSGLCAIPHVGDDESSSSCSNDEDVDDEPIMRAATHAVDVCALTIDGCPAMVVAGHVQMHSCTFPKSCTSTGMKAELRDIATGVFQAVAAVPGDAASPAIVVGCTPGSVTVFEWRNSARNPIPVRYILTGSLTRYFGIAAGCSCEGGLERGRRVATFCLFGKATAEVEEMTLRRANGAPFEIAATLHTTAPPLPSWNELCREASARLHADSPSLWVVRPEICPDVVVPHALIITVTPNGASLSTRVSAATNHPDGVSPSSSSPSPSPSLSSSSLIDVRVVEASSPDCKRAFAKLTPATSILPMLRYTGGEENRNSAEFCLFDGRHAIFFGFVDKLQLEPHSVIQLDRGDDHLVGLTWIPSSKCVMVLSGRSFNAHDGSCSGDGDGGGGRDNVENMVPVVISDLVLSVRETITWEKDDISGMLTLAKVQEVVRAAVQDENEKLLRRLEERIGALESVVLLLARQGSRSD